MRPAPDDRDAFGKALDEAGRAFDGEDANPAAAVFQRTLDRISGLWSSRSYVPAGLLARLYADERPEAPAYVSPRSDPASVAEELSLTPHLTADELNRVRREFALANHPDRVTPARRAQATQRMTIANTLIDQALRRRRSGAI
jgi:hypothetical protein